MIIDDKVKIAFTKLGQNIKEIRESENLSIEELSEKTGIRKEYLQKIEIGTAYGVRITGHLFKIAKALNTTPYNLFNFE